jgi:hypothetical protein
LPRQATPPPWLQPGAQAWLWERVKASWEIAPDIPKPPPQLWAVIWLLGGIGVASTVWSVYWGIQMLSLFSDGEFGVDLGVFVFGVLAVPFCFGLGSIYVARRLQACDRVARVLAVILCVSAAVAFLLTGDRDATLVLVALSCLGVAGVLTFDPATKDHFTGPWAVYTAEPTPVVASRILLVIVGYCMFLVGIMFLPLAALDGKLVLYGLFEIGIAVVLFWQSRRLAHGDPSARVIVTVLALVYAILSLFAGHGEPGVILPVSLALGVVALLWIPQSSRTYFDALPRPPQPALAAVERAIGGMVAALIPVAGATAGEAETFLPPRTEEREQEPLPSPSVVTPLDPLVPARVVPAAPISWSTMLSGPTSVSALVPEESRLEEAEEQEARAGEVEAEEAQAETQATDAEEEAEMEDDEAGEDEEGGHERGEGEGEAGEVAVAHGTPPVGGDDMSQAAGDELASSGEIGQETPAGRGLPESSALPTERQRLTSPGGGVPITVPTLSGSGRGFSGVVALITAAILMLDFFLPPAYSTYGGTKPWWTISFIHIDYLSLQVAGQVHNYPPILWWMSAAIALAAVALVASMITLASGGNRGAKLLIASAVGSAAAALISAEVGDPHAGLGIGCWGALAAGVVVVLAGLASFQESHGAGTSSGRSLSVLASLGSAAILIAAIAVMQNNSPSYNAYTGGGSGNTSLSTTTSTYTTTTVAPLQAEQLNDTYNFTETEVGGYTFSGWLSLGAPEVFQNGITEGNLTAGSACSINPQTDAVVPGFLTVNNTTQNFSAIGGVELQWSSGAIGGVEVGYTGGAQCEGEDSGGGSNSFGIESTDAEPDGQGASGDFFIVIPDYYSPANPHGNTSLLVGVDLDLINLVDSSHNLDIVPQTVSGPGSTSNGLYIPVDAAAQASPAAQSGQTFQIIQDDTGVMDSPSTSGGLVATLNEGANISVLCTTQGDEINNDSLWDKIASPAGYVADAYVNTNAGAGIPTC